MNKHQQPGYQAFMSLHNRYGGQFPLVYDMSNDSEKLGMQQNLDDPKSPIDRKGLFDEEERTIHHVPSGEDIKGDLKTANEAPPVEQPEILQNIYPDGGLRAWLIVFGVSAVKSIHNCS
jgi:hypothetical protein